MLTLLLTPTRDFEPGPFADFCCLLANREAKAKVAIIIDCFEIFTEHPSNLHARSGTWSPYKHHNTAKVMLGIAPGFVTYFSEPWRGRVSDKPLTEQCGILDNLIPGDVVLADH